MSWLDKLLGRGKKATGDLTGDSSMKQEGMHQEQEAMASERAESAGDGATPPRSFWCRPTVPLGFVGS
jgi:uncharacterized protein YjbJ (UPF0337 family)